MRAVMPKVPNIAGLRGVLVPITLALGGAGYVEKTYDVLTPLMALVMASAIGSGPKTWLATFAIVASVLGYVVYFSGYDFQSLLYSEVFGYKYVATFGANIAGVYPREPFAYIQTWSNKIQNLYYKYNSIEKNNENIYKFI